jgi:hypothetical protein
MEFLQSTLEEIVESERLMLLGARQRYGNYYDHARECSIFLSRSVAAVDHDRMMFSRFFSLMKKHHMLALLSILRLHKVQAMMNLRQVLEAGRIRYRESGTASFRRHGRARTSRSFASADEETLPMD